MFEIKLLKFSNMSIPVGFDYKNCTCTKSAKACGKIRKRYISIVIWWHLQ